MCFFLFDPGAGTESFFEKCVFSEPERVLLLENPADAGDFLRELERLSRRYYLAGFFSFEAGYLFEESLGAPDTGGFPYAFFGVFSKKKDVSDSGIFSRNSGGYTLSGLRLEAGRDKYLKDTEAVRELIRRGEVYQVNYTSKYRFSFNGSPEKLYLDLKSRQQAPYSVLARAGRYHILSLSPELFFRRKGDLITVKPMKGTCPRGKTPVEDLEKSRFLSRDPKNLSENLMIVDLLRNDLSRICRTGSVKTSRLFDVEKYGSLFQMTSSIEGRLRPDAGGLPDIFRSLFPSGSVTGAPKIRSMRAIRELEGSPRGVYTGCIGYTSPEGEAVFNVAIRTVVIENTEGEMGIGGGVVYDSDPVGEYEEALLKGAFLRSCSRNFSLIETILLENGKYSDLNLHLERLENSASFFSFTFPRELIISSIENIRVHHKTGRFKVRLLLSGSGELSAEASPVKKREKIRVIFSGRKIAGVPETVFHKTTEREVYDLRLRLAEERGFYDALFTNAEGEVTEGARSNVYLEKNGELLTPPVSCGLLGGTVRQKLLESGRAREKVLYPADLKDGVLYISNAVEGLVRAELAEGLLEK